MSTVAERNLNACVKAATTRGATHVSVNVAELANVMRYLNVDEADFGSVDKAIEIIDEFLHSVGHAPTCPYRRPAAECMCGRGDAMYYLTRLSSAIQTLHEGLTT